MTSTTLGICRGNQPSEDRIIYRWSNSDISAVIENDTTGDPYKIGSFWEGRIESVGASNAHVDRWMPFSSRLSRMTFTIRRSGWGTCKRVFRIQQNDFARSAPVGRHAEIYYLGGDTPRLDYTGVVRHWASNAGKISFTLEDPALLNFGVPLGPKLIDEDPQADDRFAGNLITQVYGRSTHIPFAGGKVEGNAIVLVASTGSRQVDTVSYDGTPLPDSQWVAENSCFSDGLTPGCTIVRVGGDITRKVRDFEWSGGYTSGIPYTISQLIRDVLTENGVPDTDIDGESFIRFDNLLSSRGLFDIDSPEGAIVLSDYTDTLATIIEKIQQTWAVLLYLNRDGKFALRFPAISASDEVTTLSASDIFIHRWGINTPEGASHWDIDYEAEWVENSFARHRQAVLDVNSTAFGDINTPRQLAGRAVTLHYARGQGADAIAKDRIVNERYNRYRAKLSVDNRLGIRTGDFVRLEDNEHSGSLPSYLKNKTFFVDGANINGNGMDIQGEITLSPLLGDGEGTAQPITANNTGFLYPENQRANPPERTQGSYQTGQEINERLDRFFNVPTVPGQPRSLIYSVLSGPFWLIVGNLIDSNGDDVKENGKTVPALRGEAIWPNGGAEPIHRYGIDRVTGQTTEPVPIKIRAVDDRFGFAAVKEFSYPSTNGLAVSKPDTQVTDAPTLSLTDQTDTGAVVRWGSVEKALRYDVEVDGSVVSGDDGQYATSYALSFTRRATVRVRVRGRNQIGPGPYSDEKTYLFAETPAPRRLKSGSTTEYISGPVIDVKKKIDGKVIDGRVRYGALISISWPDYSPSIQGGVKWQYQYDFSQSFLNAVTRYSYPRGDSPDTIDADFSGNSDDNLFVRNFVRRRAIYFRVRSVADDGGPSPWSPIASAYIGLQYSDFDIRGIGGYNNDGFQIPWDTTPIPPYNTDFNDLPIWIYSDSTHYYPIIRKADLGLASFSGSDGDSILDKFNISAEYYNVRPTYNARRFESPNNSLSDYIVANRQHRDAIPRAGVTISLKSIDGTLAELGTDYYGVRLT